MKIRLEIDEEILYAPNLYYAIGFMKDRFRKGANRFVVEVIE